MQMSDIANRVDYADELQSNKILSEWIQRELKGSRSKDISSYLIREQERFFNSLVIAVFGGKPKWVPLLLSAGTKTSEGLAPPEIINNTLGVLNLSGDEKLFAVDGQHRLSGMKNLSKELEKVKKSNKKKIEQQLYERILQDSVSILFVAHTKSNIERTRRLFTTLNKTAVPVSKKERIAIDENDAMAIVTRRLVENHEWFKKKSRIALVAGNNLPPNDTESLTTIGNLYDLLQIIFVDIHGFGKTKDLQFIRPTDQALEEQYSVAVTFFEQLARAIPELKEYFESADPEKVVKRYRRKNGGHLCFRPLGLWIAVSVIASYINSQRALAKKSPKHKMIHWRSRVSKLPFDLNGEPFKDVLWSTRQTIEPKAKILTRDLMEYLIGLPERGELLKRYNNFKGPEASLKILPSRLFTPL